MVMLGYTNSRPVRIVGPNREILTLETLPPPHTTRWVASRKAQVVTAVQSGLLPLDEALSRYNLSLAEYYSWEDALDRSGVAGLRVAAVQLDRAARRSRQLLNS
ncbi:DUF1153 domain-containing protein [Novosphingobium ginsenosidimutans]|uniref:DUF1153 domain-containing protein n=2 Tax=Novosphingobium ginsenosidimutans TaxID=1176536 RepID=A0A5B8SCH6_9SPHN|nr:DUF1153 domain-containing protein [Novosphingobium ginsenosidimutans]